MSSDPHGERLAKRVAALRGCSRREAELLIAHGAVAVDGVPATAPQQRVRPGQRVDVAPDARPQPLPPATLLVHKPAGLACDAADFWAALQRDASDAAHGRPALPGLFMGQRCAAPLAAPESGLVVFTQVAGVARRLADAEAPLEHEFAVEIAGPVAPEALARLRPARASIAAHSAQRTLLRLVLPDGAAPGEALRLCLGLAPQAVRRLRIGRLPLAGLPPGHWRCLRPAERF
ncbi:S4 domain-containing protein [Pseudorhodoferax sp.]|uniref:S4 domain-containing protein n=1 Tax=Pseudorhodoferax sp. TaxID=1993553 RepID=UPI0039E6DBC5